MNYIRGDDDFTVPATCGVCVIDYRPDCPDRPDRRRMKSSQRRRRRQRITLAAGVAGLALLPWAVPAAVIASTWLPVALWSAVPFELTRALLAAAGRTVPSIPECNA
jgi:hypothetical protein